MSVTTTSWDVRDYLRTPEDCALYVQAAIEEAGDDLPFIAKVLGDVAQVQEAAQIQRAAPEAPQKPLGGP